MRPVMRATTSPRRCSASVALVRGQRWAWEDLNLRPHPYRLNAGNRCADGRSRRSLPTVEAKGRFNRPTGMCSGTALGACLATS
jgi:hypothetical protein